MLYAEFFDATPCRRCLSLFHHYFTLFSPPDADITLALPPLKHAVHFRRCRFSLPVIFRRLSTAIAS
jgi:hypothetical protein